MSHERHFMIVIDPGYFMDDKRKDRLMTADAYVAEVRNVIRQIAQTQVGSSVLTTIRAWNKYVRITPNPVWDVNECTTADTVAGEAKDLQYNRTLLPLMKQWLPMVDARAIGAVVRYIPNWYAAGGSCYKKYSNRNVSDYTPTPEEVLLHELVHAVRFVSRTMNMQPQAVGGLSLYDSVEEFNAVLVENLYQSELKAPLRSSHHSFHTLDKELEGSLDFFKASAHAFEYVDTFCRTSPHFTGRLAKIKVPFNPIAAYYKNKNKARELSLSAIAKSRDAGPFGVLSTLTPWTSWEVWRQVL